MHPRQSPSDDLLRLAGLQDHVLTTEQVLGHGLSRHAMYRLLAEGQWRRLGQGAYYVAANTRPGWTSWAWAGVLLGGDAARLGPAASGHLMGLVREPPDPITVLVPVNRVRRPMGPWLYRREQPGIWAGRAVGSPPRMHVEEAVLDLCDQASGPDQVVTLLTEAVQRRLTTSRRLLRELDRRARHRHRRLVRDMLAEVADGSESALEVAYAREVERPHGLPKGNRQRSRFGLPYCSDVGYDEFALLVELDGRDGHAGAGRFRDMDRDNRFALRANLTLRYGWYDISVRPCRSAYQVFVVLSDRGRREPFRRCPRCAAVPEPDLGTW